VCCKKSLRIRHFFTIPDFSTRNRTHA
jgi:hypothetical protein